MSLKTVLLKFETTVLSCLSIATCKKQVKVTSLFSGALRIKIRQMFRPSYPLVSIVSWSSVYYTCDTRSCFTIRISNILGAGSRWSPTWQNTIKVKSVHTNPQQYPAFRHKSQYLQFSLAITQQRHCNSIANWINFQVDACYMHVSMVVSDLLATSLLPDKTFVVEAPPSFSTSQICVINSRAPQTLNYALVGTSRQLFPKSTQITFQHLLISIHKHDFGEIITKIASKRIVLLLQVEIHESIFSISVLNLQTIWEAQQTAFSFYQEFPPTTANCLPPRKGLLYCTVLGFCFANRSGKKFAGAKCASWPEARASFIE